MLRKGSTVEKVDYMHTKIRPLYNMLEKSIYIMIIARTIAQHSQANSSPENTQKNAHIVSVWL